MTGLVRKLRFAEHHSRPEIHRTLTPSGTAVLERSATNLRSHYEEPVAWRLAGRARFAERPRDQARVIPARDGLQPNVAHVAL